MYGSVVNRLMESGKQPEITVGMGGTVCHWSDRSPVTVVAIRYAKDGKTVKEIDTRADHVGPNKVTWPAQDYDITPASTEVCDDRYILDDCGHSADHPSHAPVQTWRMDGKGRLRSTYVNENGRRVMSARNGGSGLSLGHRDEYRDPSF